LFAAAVAVMFMMVMSLYDRNIDGSLQATCLPISAIRTPATARAGLDQFIPPANRSKPF
jgi:hypothetical protein